MKYEDHPTATFQTVVGVPALRIMLAVKFKAQDIITQLWQMIAVKADSISEDGLDTDMLKSDTQIG